MSWVMRRTIGSTIRRVGKAISQDNPQADIQRLGKSGVSPTPRAVEIAETTNVMTMDSTKGVAIPA